MNPLPTPPAEGPRALRPALLCLLTLTALCASEARAAADPPRRGRVERRDDADDDSDDEDDAGPPVRRGRADSSGDEAPGRRTATLAVQGPVRLRLNLQSGRVSVRATDKQQIDAALSGGGGVRLAANGSRVEVGFSGQGRQGRLRLDVPKGTALDLETLSGDVEVEGTGAEVRIHTLSGDVRASGVGPATVETVSGDVDLDGVRGQVKVHTVSGEAEVSQEGAGLLDFESTSGDLRWTGACGRDCRLDLQSLSGNLRLGLAPQSGFELSFSTRSGDVHDDFGLSKEGKPKRGRRHGLDAKAGGAEGRIECDTFSGDLSLSRTGK